MTVFKVIPQKDELLEEIFKESMKELNEFYEINWVHHLPIIMVVDGRTTIDGLKQEKSQPWSIGWSEGKTIYVLDRNNLEKESSHKYRLDTYSALIKHEISHSFYNILSGNQHKPVWLCEGTAIYTSGQNKFKKTPTEFKEFLEFYDQGGSDVYHESGFFVQMLVEKFGKQKLLELIRESRNANTEEAFNKLFSEKYGFELNYDEVNKEVSN